MEEEGHLQDVLNTMPGRIITLWIKKNFRQSKFSNDGKAG